MKTEELQQWKSELILERDKERAAVDSKYHRKLAAIDVLLEDQGPSQNKPVALNIIESYRLTKLAATREGIAQSPQRFTTASVFAYLAKKYPNEVGSPSELSNAVWMLKKDGEIEVIKAGAGPASPPEYRATSKFRPANGSGA